MGLQNRESDFDQIYRLTAVHVRHQTESSLELMSDNSVVHIILPEGRAPGVDWAPFIGRMVRLDLEIMSLSDPEGS